jgi:hypothetical protein
LAFNPDGVHICVRIWSTLLKGEVRVGEIPPTPLPQEVKDVTTRRIKREKVCKIDQNIARAE